MPPRKVVVLIARPKSGEGVEEAIPMFPLAEIRKSEEVADPPALVEEEISRRTWEEPGVPWRKNLAKGEEVPRTKEPKEERMLLT